jgi:acyl dehydratase
MDLQIGQIASLKRTFVQEDFTRFAVLSGDDNPIHVDPTFSARTKFGRPVAHGMFLYSVVCGVLGSQLPGPGTMQLGQELMFPSATYVGERIDARVELVALEPDRGVADLVTVVTRPDGNVGLQGRTVVRLPGAGRGWDHPRPPRPPLQVDPEASLKGLAIGQRAETRRTFTVHDLSEYADLTGDTNPVFTDADYARGMGLAGPIIPGGLLAGLFSYLLGTRLPGRGTNYLKQRIEFLAPAYPHQEITARVEINRIRPEKHLVNLDTQCINSVGEVVCRGEALVLVRDLDVEEPLQAS